MERITQEMDTHYKAIAVIGLGYGDEGKGSVVDYLAGLFPKTLVVRFCGGHQAAHHVVTDKTWHCFSQFGSGTFHPTSETYLYKTVFVEPFALVREYQTLLSKGVVDPKIRLKIDEDCPIVTPYHKFLCRIKELLNRKGTTGLGVGEAVEGMRRGKFMRIKDLSERWTIKGKLAELAALALWHLSEASQQVRDEETKKALEDLSAWALKELDVSVLAQMYTDFYADWKNCFIKTSDVVIPQECFILLEGAQGVLLDPYDGFAPHVTKTRCILDEQHDVFEDLGLEQKDVFKLGLTRCFPTRHGLGPFVTEDSELSGAIEDDHNRANPWQGPLRVGWLDLVALEYACFHSRVNGIFFTHADKVWAELRVCMSYVYLGDTPELLGSYFVNGTFGEEQKTLITHIMQTTSSRDLLQRTCLLEKCKPLHWKSLGSFHREDCADIKSYFRTHLVPMVGASFGPKRQDKIFWIGEDDGV